MSQSYGPHSSGYGDPLTDTLEHLTAIIRGYPARLEYARTEERKRCAGVARRVGCDTGHSFIADFIAAEIEKEKPQ